MHYILTVVTSVAGDMHMYICMVCMHCIGELLKLLSFGEFVLAATEGLKWLQKHAMYVQLKHMLQLFCLLRHINVALTGPPGVGTMYAV
jgi:hypothetical protein